MSLFVSSASDFLAEKHNKARVSRRSGYESDREFLDTLSHVVVCEFYRPNNDGVHFCEMDCEGLEHARNMARSQIDRLGAISCAIRSVGSDGKLSKPIEYHN